MDIFFIAPTVYSGDSVSFNLSLENEDLKGNFIGAINMEKGIYDAEANFYAPYYRQASLTAYMSRGYAEESENPSVNMAFKLAYSDVEEAFDYYLSQSDKPFILAGFSQGSEMIMKLLKHRFQNEGLQNRLIAAYAIGWRLEEEEVMEYPHLKPAQNDRDLGVIICYSSESEGIASSIIVPKFSLSINPLNWRIDSVLADKSLNLGACFTDYAGGINREIKEFSGAYISPSRGTLKVIDILPEDYPPILPIFKEGEYHIYDYLFFYRNLQANIALRKAIYFQEKR
ncbi:DUF3089 domain-containing protein [Lentimicrobium sp. L6]|nr:DUF3089 domain-containing protein [Lentimicrobium sp. L6]